MLKVIPYILFLIFSSACVSGDLRKDCVIVVPDQKSQAINVQVSRSEKERSRGLMYKKHLDQNEGMLFVFNGMEERTFWMKNTFLSLDIIFIDQEGAVKKILKNVPPLTESPRKSEYPVMYVLELKAGSSDFFAIKEGSKLDLGACI